MRGPNEWRDIAMYEAMNQALWQIDEHVLSAPRSCSYAVSKLIGDISWGGLLLDQAPLIRVYLDSVWQISELGVTDPGHEVGELLDGCVAKAKQNESRPFVLSINGVNPVEFLAALLAAAVRVYLATYQRTYAAEIEAETGVQGHPCKPS